jgi:hypothetical protein
VNALDSVQYERTHAAIKQLDERARSRFRRRFPPVSG